MFVAKVEILWNLVKISHLKVKIKVFLQIGEKNWHFMIYYNFWQITKPIKRHLNSSNFNILHNLVFSSGFFWEKS